MNRFHHQRSAIPERPVWSKPASAIIGTALFLSACSGSDNSTAETNVSRAPHTAGAVPPTTKASSTTTTTSIASTTTAPNAALLVIESVCTSLRSDGYETRKASLLTLVDRYSAAGGTEDAVAIAKQSCTPEIDRLEAAQEIENRVALIDEMENPVDASAFACGDGTFSVTFTNNMTTPIGLHVTFDYTTETSDVKQSSNLEPIVVWSLIPGEEHTVSGTFTEIFNSGGIFCHIGYQLFDATLSSADTSLDMPTHPELVGDDPSVWFPAIMQLDDKAVGSGNADLAAEVDDVRSRSYPATVEAYADSTESGYKSDTKVCENSITQPDEDHISLVYFSQRPARTVDGEELPAEDVLRHALFRRGNDGQWRWLGYARYFDSVLYWECGRPSATS